MKRSESSFRAMLVGNAHFDVGDPELHPLNGPLNDVEALRSALTGDTGLFEHAEVLKDATSDRLRSAAGEFFADAGQDDCRLFYYSGHGRLDPADHFYLCASDTDSRKSLHTPRLAGHDLSRMVDHSPARLKIIILDCCYASSFKGGDWVNKYRFGEGCCVLAARQAVGPLVPDARTDRDLSPFTALLVEALGSRELDADNDGLVTIDEVATYINDRAGQLPRAPFSFQHWVGVGTVPIARSVEMARRARPVLIDADADHPPAPDTVEFPVPARPGNLPELIPVPSLPVCLGRHLVTNAQFRRFLAAPENAGWRPRAARAELRHVDRNYLRAWNDLDFPPGLDHHPVVSISMAAAQAYAGWAGRHSGRPYRLPEVREWQSAAAAGRTDADWIAADLDAGRINYRGTLAALAAAGDFEPNPHGFCDLAGNAWDLCVDADGAPVLLGGAFNTPRGRLGEHLPLGSPSSCRDDVGFRCAAVQNPNIESRRVSHA